MAEEDRLVSEVNRLYWQTEASVSDIADELSISRRALYDAIEPAPAGAACPECGSALAYRNRTAQGQGEAECPECGLERDLDELEGSAGPQEKRKPAGSRMPLDVSSLDATRGLWLAGAVVAGVAAGALVAILSRRD